MGSFRSRGAAVPAGLAAAAAGTLAMDALLYSRYRRGGGRDGFLAWETSAGLESWDDAPAPALVGKRVIEYLRHRDLAAQHARITNNAMHWLYGLSWGVPYAFALSKTVHSRMVLAALLGPSVWASGYVVLPWLGLYKPIWEYDLDVLARDLSAHCVYGLVTGATFWALDNGGR